MAQRQDNITAYPSSYDTTNYSYSSVNSSYPLSNAVGMGSGNTTYAQWNLTTGSNAESYVFYIFDLSSIPQGATIDSVECTSKVYISNTRSGRINYRQIQMYYGTSTAKGSASTVSTSTSAITMDCGDWTRDELNDCRIRIYAKRGTSSTTSTYYNRFYGATLTVTYTFEDVQYTITSSANSGGAIDPVGSTTVYKSDGYLLKIIPDDNMDLYKILIDDVDVTSDARKIYISSNMYTVNDVSGASYGFELNSDNYYESTNQGNSNTASLCRVVFNLPVAATVDFYVINYGESSYDYGILGNINSELSTSYSADSSYKWSGSGKQSSSEQVISYDMEAGESFIDVKYRKDSSVDSGNDSLQFRIEITLSEEVAFDSWYYEYELLDIQNNHDIVVTFTSLSGDTTKLYLKINGTWTTVSKVYKKIDGIWVEQTDLESLFDTSTNYVKG